MEGAYVVEALENGRISKNEVPMRNAMNEVLRDDYYLDNQRNVDVWNRLIKKFGIDFEIKMPHKRFNRKIGMYSQSRFDTEGNPISEQEWQAKRDLWLPSAEDETYVKSLMKPCLKPGQMANWIAPPSKGINDQPVEFEYVKL